MDVAENSLAANTGTITTLGAGSHAAKVSGSAFVNAGTLDSAQGNAVQAENGSLVTLLDGTALAGSRVLADDGTSTLAVLMDGNLAAQVDGFGNLVKAGEGTFLLESGSSAGNTLNLQGTLEIENASRFVTGNFAQMPGAALYLYANPASATDFNAIPLWVEGDAFIRGGLTIDMANAASLPGIYTFIRAENYDADFETSFVNLDPLFTPYGPQWLTGGSWLYTSMVGYSFSESALGLVSAIQDWSLLRWVMGNHMADVAGGLVDLEDGARHYHFQGLYGKTERDPAGDSQAGFDAEQSGVSIGFDQKVNEQTAWGLYAGYTKNDLDITRVGPAKSDWEEQESWHLGGYLMHRTGDWILTNALTYRATDHETFRKQMNGDATADFDSWSITNDFRVGNVVKEIGDGSNWEVVPEFGFNFGYINRDGYSEKNGFDYDDFDTTVWEGVLGIRFRGEFEQENGSKWVPNMRLSWVHMLSGDDVTVSQGWYGDWHRFTEELDDDYFVVDLGVSLFTAGDAQISLNYNGRFGDNSDFHGAWLRFMKTF